MYLVFCREDSTTAPDGHPYRERYPDGRIPGKFVQATRRTFDYFGEAQDYARGTASGRDPFVLRVAYAVNGSDIYVAYGNEQLKENSKRLEFAREVGIDW